MLAASACTHALRYLQPRFVVGLLAQDGVSKNTALYSNDLDTAESNAADNVLASCLWAAVDPAAGGPSIGKGAASLAVQF